MPPTTTICGERALSCFSERHSRGDEILRASQAALTGTFGSSQRIGARAVAGGLAGMLTLLVEADPADDASWERLLDAYAEVDLEGRGHEPALDELSVRLDAELDAADLITC